MYSLENIYLRQVSISLSIFLMERNMSENLYTYQTVVLDRSNQTVTEVFIFYQICTVLSGNLNILVGHFYLSFSYSTVHFECLKIWKQVLTLIR